MKKLANILTLLFYFNFVITSRSGLTTSTGRADEEQPSASGLGLATSTHLQDDSIPHVKASTDSAVRAKYKDKSEDRPKSAGQQNEIKKLINEISETNIGEQSSSMNEVNRHDRTNSGSNEPKNTEASVVSKSSAPDSMKLKKSSSQGHSRALDKSKHSKTKGTDNMLHNWQTSAAPKINKQNNAENKKPTKWLKDKGQGSAPSKRKEKAKIATDKLENIKTSVSKGSGKKDEKASETSKGHEVKTTVGPKNTGPEHGEAHKTVSSVQRKEHEKALKTTVHKGKSSAKLKTTKGPKSTEPEPEEAHKTVGAVSRKEHDKTTKTPVHNGNKAASSKHLKVEASVGPKSTEPKHVAYHKTVSTVGRKEHEKTSKTPVQKENKGATDEPLMATTSVGLKSTEPKHVLHHKTVGTVSGKKQGKPPKTPVHDGNKGTTSKHQVVKSSDGLKSSEIPRKHSNRKFHKSKASHKKIDQNTDKDKAERIPTDGDDSDQEHIIFRDFNHKRAQRSSNFPLMFLASIILLIAVYAMYHNRQKIIAIVVEGRGPGRSQRPNSSHYTKLEDAMPSVRKVAA